MRNLEDDLSSYFDEVEVRGIEIGLSEKLARDRHPDFDVVIVSVFREMAVDPELRRRLLAASDIAESCYQHGSQGLLCGEDPPIEPVVH